MGDKLHKKVMVPDSRFGINAFGDYYRFVKDEPEEFPYIIYIGGVITRDDYEQRRNSEPLPIIKEFEAAFESCRLQGCDLLVMPCPVFREKEDEKLREAFKHFVVFDMMPLTDNPRPNSIGYVGFSFGAFLAACLTFDLPRSKVLSCLGGTGMASAAWESAEHGFEGKSFKCWGTADDPLVMENYKFLHALVAKNLDMDIELGPGGHKFNDYAKNGFVEKAFQFALDAFNLEPSSR